MYSYNQCGQEVFVRDFFKDKPNGVFVDIGAYDGVESSNTYFLEKDLGWSGICVEANPNYFNNLQVNRPNCRNINIACMPYRGHCLYNGINTTQINVSDSANSIRCDTLDSILHQYLCTNNIDYMSMDIEGNEVSVLEKFPFTKWDIKILTLEHNLYLDGPSNKNKLYEIMTCNGYTKVFDNVLCELGPYEDWYIKNDVLNNNPTL